MPTEQVLTHSGFFHRFSSYRFFVCLFFHFSAVDLTVFGCNVTAFIALFFVPLAVVSSKKNQKTYFALPAQHQTDGRHN